MSVFETPVPGKNRSETNNDETDDAPDFDRIPEQEERWRLYSRRATCDLLGDMYDIRKSAGDESPISELWQQTSEKLEAVNAEVTDDMPNLPTYRDAYPEPEGDWYIDSDDNKAVFTADEPGPFDVSNDDVKDALESRTHPLFLDVEAWKELSDRLENHCDSDGYYVTESDGGSGDLQEAIAYLEAEVKTSGNGWGKGSQNNLETLLREGGFIN